MATVTDEMVAGLPPPVARSLRRSRVVGREIPKVVSLRQAGELLLRGRWLPFTADEEYRLDPPEFVWRGTVRLAGLAIAHAEDSLHGGRGKMRVRLFGLVPVVDEAGPEMDQGSLMRWLNETIWFPQVWATDVISWTPIDQHSAMGSVSAGDVTVEAEFRFDIEGRVVDFRADRYRSTDSGFVLTPWRTPISVHVRFDGIEVPSSGSATWVLDGGDLEYIRIRVTDVTYDPRAEASSRPTPSDDPTPDRSTMRAIVQHEYGLPDVLALGEVPKPSPEDGEVLVKVRAASVQAGDWHFLTGLPYVVRPLRSGLLQPKNSIPGFDVAGRVEAVGRNVRQLQPGDQVFGSSAGAFADRLCAEEAQFALKPANITFEQAAAVPSSALAALQGLRDAGNLRAGQRVVINGASGGVGTFAVQIAKSFGAHVTGVCSTRNMDMVRSIGADEVVDYTREDFTRNGRRYGLIFDIAGNHSLSDCRSALTPRGTYVLVGDSGGRWFGSLVRFITTGAVSPFVSQRMRPFVAMPSHADLVVLKELLESGEITPVIDRTYPLDRAPEALGYVGEGHAPGKVVITM